VKNCSVTPSDDVREVKRIAFLAFRVSLPRALP
jgi:hypothetical protein